MVPLVAQFEKWLQKLHFSPILLYHGTFGGQVGKVGAEIALFTSLTELRYIWWPTDKVGAEIALFTSLAVVWYIWLPTKKVGGEIALFRQSNYTMIHLDSH